MRNMKVSISFGETFEEADSERESYKSMRAVKYLMDEIQYSFQVVLKHANVFYETHVGDNCKICGSPVILIPCKLGLTG